MKLTPSCGTAPRWWTSARWRGGILAGALTSTPPDKWTVNTFEKEGGGSAFVWDGTRLQRIGTLGGSFSAGTAINASGQVTGGSETTNGASHAFLWDGTTMLDLGTLEEGRFSSGTDLNDAGQVTGFADSADGFRRAFLWDGTTMLDLGTLGGSFSTSVAINASGQVAGISETTDGALHGFLWDGTTLQDLGALGGSPFNRSLAINASGQVTGTDFNADDENAFLWDGTALHNLNALIDPADPLQPFIDFFAGVDINDLGQILANGVDSRTGESHAYVVSPFSVPESGTLALLGLGLAGLGIARRRRAA